MAEKVKRIRRPSAQRWKLARLPKGPLQLKGASEFCQLLMGLMARWKQIGPGDKMILAYIAEKIWSQGKYMQPLEKLAADTQPTWWSVGAQQMSYKMCVLHSLEYLEYRGLIKLNYRRIYYCGGDYETLRAWTSRMYKRPHGIVILNDDLAALLKNGAAG